MLANVVRERRGSPDRQDGDVLDHVIEDMNVEKFLTEDVVVQLMFGLLFVNFDSLSSTLTLAFKLLSENPLVLEELTVSKPLWQIYRNLEIHTNNNLTYL